MSTHTFVVEAVLFDLDGVIVRSERAIERAWKKWASKRGVRWDEVKQTIHGRVAVDTIRAVLPDVPLESALQDAEDVMALQIGDTIGCRPVPGVKRLLSCLPAAILLILSVMAIATAFVALATSFGRLGRIETKGTTMGLYVAILYAGLATGPALFGRAIETSGFAVGFAWCAGTAVVLAVAAAVAHRFVESHQERGRGEEKA